MKGAFKITTLWNVPVMIHWSFFLLPLWIGASSLYEGMSLTTVGWLLTYVLLLFLCVLLHEFGHILMARRFGVGTQDVVLTPIGGVARLNSMPEKPKNEFFVSIAGPLVNVGIALLLSPSLFYFSLTDLLNLGDIEVLFASPKYFMQILILANLMLVGFNLIPAFPLDGGRMLRAGLASKLGRRRGTRIAAIIGKFIAVTMLVGGYLLTWPSLALIGIFVFVMATIEYKAIANEAVLRKATIAEIMNSDFPKIYLNTPMSEVVRAFSAGTSMDFVVLGPMNLPEGIIREKSIEQALIEDRLELAAENYLSPLPNFLSLETKLGEADFLIKRSGLSMLPILKDGFVIGCASRKNINHYMVFSRRLTSFRKKNLLVGNSVLQNLTKNT